MASRSYHYNSQGRMDYFGSNQLVYNNEGQLTSFGSITFEYNKYGARKKKTVNNEDIYYYWFNGKLLVEITSGVIFTYDYRGIRHTKETNKETITYYYDNNKLIGENHVGKTYQNTTYPSFKLRFFYDNDGTPLGFKYITDTEEKDYIYIVNPFKEVVGISYYNNSPTSLTCSLEAIYIYDAWGNHKVMSASGVENTSDEFIGNINPLRFKGYYYDKESNLYYLISRYYDPSIGQFISPDDYNYLDINKVSGYHLYAYCNNNPVMNVDQDGHFLLSTSVLIGAIVGAAVGIAVGFGIVAYKDYKDDGDVFNKSVAWYDYVGASVVGGIIGAVIGAAIGYGIGYAAGGTYSNGLVAKSVSSGVKSFFSQPNKIHHALINANHKLGGFTIKSLKHLMKSTLAKGVYVAYKSVDSMVWAAAGSQVTYIIIDGVIYISDIWFF